VRDILLPGGLKAFASDGAPSDCVALALLGYFPDKIDLVVSGINPMPNLGHDVTYSGTVTAAMEAVIWGVPGIAFSLDIQQNQIDEIDYSPAAKIAQKIVANILKQRMPAGILLNVNIPNTTIRGARITRQGLRVYRDRLDQRIDPRGRSYYWIGGDAPTGLPEEGTDIGALAQGYVSITPLQLDLTAYPAIQAFKKWSWDNLIPEDIEIPSRSNGRV
jgi:5'-nucleotidase